MGIPIEAENEKDARTVQDILRAVARTKGYVPGLGIVFDQQGRSPSPGRGVVQVQFFAAITGHSVISTAVRWLYTFTEVAATPTFATGGVLTGVSFATFTGARTGNCVNLAEIGNVTEPTGAAAWYLADVDAHGDDYPAGFALMPIGAGGTSQTHKVNRVVRLTQLTDSASGNTWWYFDRQNTHDGTCEA